MGRARGTNIKDRQSEIRDLGDLVTGALAQEEVKRPQTLAEIAAEPTINAQDILSEGRQAETNISTNDPEEVRKIIAPVATKYLNVFHLRSSGGMPSNPGTALFISLLDYLDKKDDQSLDHLRSFLRRTNNRLELRQLLQTDDRAISFLEDLWGDRACEKISGMTQTRPQTVQKWLGGSSPSSSNSSRIGQIVTIAYQLEKECGVNKKDVAAWMEKPHAELSGKSIEDAFAFSRYSWVIPEKVHNLMRSLGADM